MHKNADAGGSINAFFCLLSGVVSVLTFYISTTETQIPIKKIKKYINSVSSHILPTSPLRLPQTPFDICVVFEKKFMNGALLDFPFSWLW